MRLPYRELPDRPTVWEDEWGVQWDRSIDTDIGTVCNRRVTQETLSGYRFPDAAAPARFERFPAAIEAGADGRFTVATLAFTLFERAWTLAGMEEVLMAMAAGDSFAEELFDGILAFDEEVVRRALSCEIDGVRFGDDWGQQQGLIMGPVLWRSYIKPRIARLYGLVRKAGRKVFIHCCGKVDEIFPDLIECGVDVFNPFQPEVMDVVGHQAALRRGHHVFRRHQHAEDPALRNRLPGEGGGRRASSRRSGATEDISPLLRTTCRGTRSRKTLRQ